MNPDMRRRIALDLIDRDPDQPRKAFDDQALDELAGSIRDHGLLHAVVLRPSGDRFAIVCGDRRVQAVRRLAWQDIPAEVLDLPAAEARWLALVENIQRENLSPIEEAEAYRALIADGVTQTEVARRIGKSQPYVAHRIRLLGLPEAARALISRGCLTDAHGRELLRIRDLYGENLERDLPLDDLAHMAVWEAVNAIRPEEQSRWWCLPTDDRPEVLCGTGAMLLEVHDAGGRLRQWSVAATWWAIAAAACRLSSRKLHSAIAAWWERVVGGVVFAVADRAGVAVSEAERWGARADLRHAGIDPDNLPVSVAAEAVVLLGTGLPIVLPSATQGWREVAR